MENYTEAGCLNEDRRVVEIDDDPEAKELREDGRASDTTQEDSERPTGKN